MSIVVRVGEPGELGLNVISCPAVSTAVHCVLDGHATLERALPLPIVMGVGCPGEFGLNVTSYPWPSTAVHCVLDGHATLLSTEEPLGSTSIGPDHDSVACAAPGKVRSTSAAARHAGRATDRIRPRLAVPSVTRLQADVRCALTVAREPIHRDKVVSTAVPRILTSCTRLRLRSCPGNPVSYLSTPTRGADHAGSEGKRRRDGSA
jgi:hypothetical protein